MYIRLKQLNQTAKAQGVKTIRQTHKSIWYKGKLIKSNIEQVGL